MVVHNNNIFVLTLCADFNEQCNTGSAGYDPSVCGYKSYCPTAGNCCDNIDNDCDGNMDCDDPDCNCCSDCDTCNECFFALCDSGAAAGCYLDQSLNGGAGLCIKNQTAGEICVPQYPCRVLCWNQFCIGIDAGCGSGITCCEVDLYGDTTSWHGGTVSTC